MAHNTWKEISIDRYNYLFYRDHEYQDFCEFLMDEYFAAGEFEEVREKFLKWLEDSSKPITEQPKPPTNDINFK